MTGLVSAPRAAMAPSVTLLLTEIGPLYFRDPARPAGTGALPSTVYQMSAPVSATPSVTCCTSRKTRVPVAMNGAGTTRAPPMEVRGRARSLAPHW
jgi:hypothetical protein